MHAYIHAYIHNITLRYITLQLHYITLQYNTIQYNTIQYNDDDEEGLYGSPRTSTYKLTYLENLTIVCSGIQRWILPMFVKGALR